MRSRAGLRMRQDAYLCSLRLDVGKKLCFLCLHLPKYFYGTIGLSWNCFLSWYARDAGFSHMYTELKTLFWVDVVRGSAIYYWLLFHYICIYVY